MAQLDVHRNLAKPPANAVLYLLDVQSDFLDIFDTRGLVPLFLAGSFARPLRHLNPSFRIEGVAIIMAIRLIAGTSLRNLGEVVTSLADQRGDIIGAIDILITGV